MNQEENWVRSRINPSKEENVGAEGQFLHKDQNVALRNFALKTSLPLQNTLNPCLKAVTSMLLKELWGTECQIYSSKPTDPLGSQNWLLLWKRNVSTGPGTSRTKIWTSGNQWLYLQMLQFLYFLSYRILIRCTIHVCKLYFPLWSVKSWTHLVFSFLWKICFSDDSTFKILAKKSQYVQICPGEKYHPECVVQTVIHPTKVMIWSAISRKGTGHLYMVQGMMKQDKCKQMLMDRLFPQVRDWFPNEESFVFMQDGPPCHTARSLKAFLHEQNKPQLFWLGNLTDMNPIENVYELVKREMANDITSKQQLIVKLIKVWCHNSKMQERVEECINSMPRRIKALIDAKGRTTKYWNYGWFFYFVKNWYVNKFRSIPTSSLYLLSTIVLIQLVFTFRHVKL